MPNGPHIAPPRHAANASAGAIWLRFRQTPGMGQLRRSISGPVFLRSQEATSCSRKSRDPQGRPSAGRGGARSAKATREVRARVEGAWHVPAAAFTERGHSQSHSPTELSCYASYMPNRSGVATRTRKRAARLRGLAHSGAWLQTNTQQHTRHMTRRRRSRRVPHSII